MTHTPTPTNIFSDAERADPNFYLGSKVFMTPPALFGVAVPQTWIDDPNLTTEALGLLIRMISSVHQAGGYEVMPHLPDYQCLKAAGYVDSAGHLVDPHQAPIRRQGGAR